MRALLALALAIVLSGCAHLAGGADRSDLALRAMTYNIRLDLASDGPNSWPHRKALVAALIGYEAPDVLGLQEVLLHQKTDLEAALPEFAFVGVARDDGVAQGEFSPLAFRRDRFELVDSGTFWLSPTPSRPGRAWDAALPRIATWALLRERGAGLRRIAVLNTHFDHVGAEARANSAAIIADWAAERAAAGDPVVVLGDFNLPPSSEPMALLGDPARSRLRLTRSASAAPPYGPPGTFNGFRIDSAPSEPIDHVLVSDHFRVVRFATVTQHWGGRLASDHYPVAVDLILRRVAATPK